nr:hypothetical protein [Tanacetum cinerariifolium]
MEISKILQCLSLKTTAWNEFSSNVASAIICLATNQKFNFLKWIFDSMGRNLDNLSEKILMYPRFIQVFLDNQIDLLSNHERKYVSSTHTKNFLVNIRMIRKGFSGIITPLFPTMVVQSQLGEGSAMPTDPHHAPIILQSSSSQPQKTHKPRKPTRKVIEVPQPSDPMEHVADEAVYKKLRDSLVRASTTSSSLEAEQDSGNINRTQSKETPNESSSQRTSSGGGPKVDTLRSDEGRMKLNELMELCTNLQTILIDLEKTKTTQVDVIDSLKMRVKKLERRNKSRTHKLKRLYKVGLTARVESLDNEESLGEDASKQERRIDDIDADEDITLVNVQADAEMFDANKDLDGEEVFVEQEVIADKEKIDEDRGKGILIKEPVKPKKKDQIRLDEEVALNLQAEFDEEQRLAREKTKKELEANISLIETWDDVQAKIDVDHQLAKRLQAEEQQ